MMGGAMGGRSPDPGFVGRQQELVRLDLALERSTAGSPGLVLIGGEAGVGKSRLLLEWRSRLDPESTRVLTGSCFELSSGAVPYGPFVEVLRDIARALEDEERDLVLGADRHTVARILPELDASSGARDARHGHETPGAGDVSAQGRLFGAAFGILSRASELRPLVIVIEDLHWADDASRDLVRYIARGLRSERLLLVATYRSDELDRFHPLRPFLADVERLPMTEAMPLRPFERDEVMQQLAAITGTPPDARDVDRMVRRSNGNAFLIEELVAADAHGPAARLPDSLQRILTQRTAGMTGTERIVLDAAAVIGARVDHELLAGVTGLTDEALGAALRACVDAHVLLPATTNGRPGYVFRHALVQEALYAEVLPADRVALHATVAAHLMTRPDRVAELAHHAREALDLPAGAVELYPCRVGGRGGLRIR